MRYDEFEHDEFEYDDDFSQTSRVKYYVSFVFTALMIIALLFLQFYPRYAETQPVSFRKLIKLHTQNEVTKEILVKHMYAKPHGEAIKPIVELANAGNMHAQNISCWVYSEGFNVEKDLDLSAKYCHKAAAQNHPGAQMNLGVYYAEYATPKDMDKAIHYYTMAAEHRADASWYLSNIYEKHPAPIRNFELAIKYKSKAADMGNIHAMMSLAENHQKAQLGLLADHRIALRYYEMAKNAGHVDAHAWLSVFYRDAEPQYRNYDKMVSHAQKAIVFNGHPSAFGVMGDAYLKGHGVEKNERTAARYYAMGAERGNQYAVNKLAFLDSEKIDQSASGFRYDGVTIPYTFKNAINYPENFHHAYKLMNDGSLNPLVKSKVFEYYADGILEKHDDGYVPIGLLSSLFSGRGHSENFTPVIQAYETAANYSGEHAYELGLIYMSGSGVKRNPETCLEWISKAMDLGYPDMRDYVGLYLMQPDNLSERETQKSRDLLQKAAVLGSEVAAETLGVFYQDGIGVEVNKSLAMYWFNHADRGRHDKGDIIFSLRRTMDVEELSKADYLIKNCKKSEISTCSQNL